MIAEFQRGRKSPGGPLGLALIALMAAGCASSRLEIEAVGWAWPLPPLSQRSPAVAARAREAAELERLRRAAPWAGQQLAGRGSATTDQHVEDPVIVHLLRQAQAREAARRHLAERVAALSIPGPANLRGPSPRLGDPARLSPDQAARINDLIARAPVVVERELAGGQLEVQVALPLDNVARILLNEPIVENVSKKAAAAEPSGKKENTPPSESNAPFPPPTSEGIGETGKALESQSSPKAKPVAGKTDSGASGRKGRSGRPSAVRSGLAPLGDAEILDAGRYASDAARVEDSPSPVGGETASTAPWDPRQADPQTRLEARQRAETLARRWLGDAISARKLESGMTPGSMAALLPSVRQLLQQRIEQAPVRNVVWDDLGRCRVTVRLDWDSLEKELTTGDRSPESARAPSDPLSLP